MSAAQIVNVQESTSVVCIDGSTYTSGNYALIYLSSSVIPGHLVTVTDLMGAISSPQSILLSTVQGIQFTDGSHSTIITQRYGYKTLVATTSTQWTIINTSPFSGVSETQTLKGTDAHAVYTGSVSVGNQLSSVQTTTDTIRVNTLEVSSEPLYCSTLVCGPGLGQAEIQATVNGSALIKGSFDTLGTFFEATSLRADSNLFAGGSLSTLGTFTTGGSIFTNDSIYIPIGSATIVGSALVTTASQFGGSVAVVGPVELSTLSSMGTVSTPTVYASQTTVVQSTVQIGPVATLVSRSQDILITSPLTVNRSISTLNLEAATSIQTSDLYCTALQGWDTLSSIQLGSTSILNQTGSLALSSISANSLTTGPIDTLTASVSSLLTIQTLQLNNANPYGTYSIMVPPGSIPPIGSITLSNYWTISSIGANGTFQAPILSTTFSLTNAATISSFYVPFMNATNVAVDSLSVYRSIVFEPDCYVNFGSTAIQNVGGYLSSFASLQATNGFAGSLTVDRINSPGTLYFGSSLSSVTLVGVSTLNAQYVGISSLFTSMITLGSPISYSTMAPSSIWLSQVDSPLRNVYTPFVDGNPYRSRSGLGSYIQPVEWNTYTNGTTVFTPVDPINQRSTVAGTIQTISTFVTLSTYATMLGGTPAYDSTATLYSFMSTSGSTVAAKDRGIRLFATDSNGVISTIGGVYQYYRTNGLLANQTEFGPTLGITVQNGVALVSDRINFEIRAISSSGIVSRFAGTTLQGYTNGSATTATLGYPWNTSWDQTGSNVYIADGANAVVRLFTAATGAITTVAGTGVSGYSGDGGPAILAQLRAPRGIAVDLSGVVYIADSTDNRVRRIDPLTRIITTFAGTGVAGYSGDAGLATNARLSGPTDISVTATGDLYVCDRGNHRIRKVAAGSGIITTVAGTGVAGFTGDGTATMSRLNAPTSIAAYSFGGYYPAKTLYIDTTALISNSAYTFLSNSPVVTFPNLSTIRAVGGTGTYSATAYSGDAYSRECSMSFVPLQTSNEFVAGLGVTPYLYNGSLNGMELGFRCSTNGSAYVQRYNGQVASAGSWTSTTTFRVDFTGLQLIAYKNNVPLYSTMRAINSYQVLYMTADFKQSGSQQTTLTNITFNGSDQRSLVPTVLPAPAPPGRGEASDTGEATTVDPGVFFSTISNVDPSYSVGSIEYKYSEESTDLFCVMGSTGTPNRTILYSRDGVNWDPSPNAHTLLSRCLAVAWNGSLWVAAGTPATSGASALLYSADAITWTASPSNPFTSQATSLAWNGFRWMAAGSGGNSLVYSNNGINWFTAGVSAPAATSVVWFAANSLWIAGSPGQIAISSDSIQWDLQSSATGLLDVAMGSMASNQNICIAVGDGTTTNVIVTTDGFTWTTLPAASSLLDAAYSVAWNGTMWIIAGTNFTTGTVLIYSYDGANWFRSANDSDVFPIGAPSPNGLTWNGVRWIITIAGINVQYVSGYSEDGIKWISNACAKALLSAGGGIGSKFVQPIQTNPTIQYNAGTWTVKVYAAYISNRIPGGGNATLSAGMYVNGVLQVNALAPVLLPSQGLTPVYRSALPCTFQFLMLTPIILQSSDVLDFRFSAVSTNPEGGTIRIYTNFSSAIDYPGQTPITVYQSQITTPITGAGFNNNIYVADTDNHRVRLIDEKNNQITTVAGTGVPDSTGDEGPATQATLTSPASVSVDVSGYQLYIADRSCRVRTVDQAGLIHGVAGNGSPGTTANGLGAISTVFNGSRSTTFDAAGFLYYSDPGSFLIRKINPVTKVVTTVAGTPGVQGSTGDGGLATAATIGAVYSLAVNSAMNTLFFGEYDNCKVRRINLTTGIVTTVAGTGVAGYTGDGGLATSARINPPLAIGVDTIDNLYISDPVKSVIRKVSVFTKVITTIVGIAGSPGYSGNGSLGTYAQITQVPSIVMDSINNPVFSDTGNNQIRKYTFATGTVTAYAGSGAATEQGDGGPALTAGIPSPLGIAFTPNWTNLAITSAQTSTIRRTSPAALSNAPLQFMNFRGLYTNTASASPAYMILAVNGTPVLVNTTATASMTLTDRPIATYPFTKLNPITGDFTPFVELTHWTGNTGRQRTTANLWVTQTPGQAMASSNADSNAGILVNSYAIKWPNALNVTTVQNAYGDISLRNLIRTGSLTQVSDPELKEDILDADLDRCYTSIRTLPLHRYSYIQPYRDAFRIEDQTKLGLLTTEVATLFPNSVVTRPFEPCWDKAPSSIQMLSLAQIQYAHIGATKALQQRIATLRTDLESLQRGISALRTAT